MTLSILIAEDDAMISYLLTEVLIGMGHAVCASVDTEAGAIAAAQRCGPDLVIVDEHLEEGSGLGVIKALLRRGPVNHIFVSGDTDKIRRLMPNAVIVAKPYREEDLAAAIERAVALGQDNRPLASGRDGFGI